MSIIAKRFDFVFFFDVQDGNPNGDPDAGNLPRIDAETGKGLVTDVCIKRKVRNYIQIVKESKKPFDIFVKEKAILNSLIDEAHEQEKVKTKEKGEKTEAARQWMCSQYYDVRTFGAVMSTGKNAGQVRGPIQLTFARSVEPVVALEHSITRMAVATKEEAEKQSGDNRTMGRKFTVPYGLYRAHGFISAHLSAQTGFSEEDLKLFWKALCGRDSEESPSESSMFDHDHSAARGLMGPRGLIIFEHGSALGTANAATLFERVTVKRVTEGPARQFADYQILLDGQLVQELPKFVKV